MCQRALRRQVQLPRVPYPAPRKREMLPVVPSQPGGRHQALRRLCLERALCSHKNSSLEEKS